MLGQPIFPGDSGVDQLVEIIKVNSLSYSWIEVLFLFALNPVCLALERSDCLPKQRGKRPLRQAVWVSLFSYFKK
jgi:hypothetical protein